MCLSQKNNSQVRMILVFEDNIDLANVVRKLFFHVFHEKCVVTREFQQAVALVLAGDVRVILSDLDMLGKGGLDFIKKIRNIKPHSLPPVIVFTGLNTSDESFREAKSICDAIYEKGETSLMELCGEIRKFQRSA